MKVEVAIPGSLSPISLMVSVDVKHHKRKKERKNKTRRVQRPVDCENSRSATFHIIITI